MVIQTPKETLFDQVKGLEIIGERLTGEPEIVHEIEDHFRQVEPFPIIRNQIRKILEYVPSAFPEGWQSPEGYDQLTPEQREAYMNIAKSGLQPCTGPVIQKVIELGVEYRKQYGPQGG